MFTSNSVDKIETKDANKIEFVYDADGKYINDDVVPSNILLEWTRIYANKAFVNNENGNEYHEYADEAISSSIGVPRENSIDA